MRAGPAARVVLGSHSQRHQGQGDEKPINFSGAMIQGENNGIGCKGVGGVAV